MIYRLLRALFWIKVNVNKEKLFNILNVEYGKRDINNLKEKQNYSRLHSILNTRKEKSMVEYLSLKTIKLKLDCLFQRKPVKPKLSWHEIINSYHVVNWCPKTRQ